MAVFKRKAKKKVLIKKSGNTVSIKPAPKPKKKKGILKKIGGAIKKTAGAVITAPLLPFKPAMKKNLESKGIATKSMKFETIIEQFFNHNISKKADKASSYDEVPAGYISDNYLMKVPYENLNESDNLAADAIVLIVKETINFFKKKKDQKAAVKAKGENPSAVMSPADLEAAAAAEKVTKDLETKAADEQAVSKGKMNNMVKYGLIFAVVAFAIYWFGFKKK